MFNNFHEIKAVVSNCHGFTASFYGIAEYVRGMIRNQIKIKNSIVQTKLYFQTKFKESSVRFRNSELSTTILSALKPEENEIKFINEIKTKLFSSICPDCISEISFLDKPIQKINILFVPILKNNNIKFENNESKINVALQGRTKENKTIIDNNNNGGIHTTMSLLGKLENNNFSFKNGTVNAGTWKFLTLGDISGTLNEIEKSPLEYLGRRKIIQ